MSGEPAPDSTADAALTPMQRRTIELLRRPADPVVFDPAFVASLQDEFDAAFGGFAARVGDHEIYLSKYKLRSVLGCEVLHLEPDDFEWTPARAVGKVAHRAIELLAGWRSDPSPSDLVDEAIERLADREDGFADWIGGLGEADRADIRTPATNKVIAFQDCFPPFKPVWRARTEARIRWPPNGPISLAGQVDLMLGRPHGAESTLVLIDLKTGRGSPHDREDLRFYALLETLRSGVPPRTLASFYLDVGTPVVEDLTEGVLRSAARRTLDAIDAEISLKLESHPPTKQPGVACRWCPLSDDCDEGSSYLDDRDDPDRAF